MIKSNNWWFRTKSIDYRLIKFKSTRTFFSLLILSPVCVGIGKERSWRERERERDRAAVTLYEGFSSEESGRRNSHALDIMDKREPCGVEIQSSLRTSSASINTEVTQVDSSNPYDSDRPISYREIELEHLDGNSNREHAKDLKACESCVSNPDLEQNPLHVNPTVRNAGIEERDRSLMKAERAEIKSRRRMIVMIVTLLCLAGAVQGILVNGLINVVISSLEKR